MDFPVSCRPPAVLRRSLSTVVSRLAVAGIAPAALTADRPAGEPHHVTGMPFSTALPESGSTSASSARTLAFTPAWRAATPSRAPSASWPQPWGRLTTPVRMSLGDLDGHGHLAHPRGRPRRRRHRPGRRRSASYGCTCSVQRGRPFTSTSTLCIQELFERRSRRPTSTSGPSSAAAGPSRARSASSAVDVGDQGLVGELDRGRSACAGSRAAEARAARGRRRGDARGGRRGVSPPGSAPKASPYGPVRSIRSSSRSGPRRPVSASTSSSSSGSRPWTGLEASRHGVADEAGDRRLVDRDGIGVRPPTGGQRGRAWRGSPTPRAPLAPPAARPG